MSIDRYGDSMGTLQRASQPNEVWTYDFLQARTERGGQLRILTVLDEYTCECLHIYVAASISSRQVIAVLDWLFVARSAPSYIRGDKVSEFIAYALQEWLRDRTCHRLYINLGSPWENPFIETFNGTVRNDCLNRWIFSNGQEARELIETWRLEYYLRRPHSSLGYLPPAVFAQQASRSLRLD
jgi:putative transposase